MVDAADDNNGDAQKYYTFQRWLLAVQNDRVVARIGASPPNRSSIATANNVLTAVAVTRHGAGILAPVESSFSFLAAVINATHRTMRASILTLLATSLVAMLMGRSSGADSPPATSAPAISPDRQTVEGTVSLIDARRHLVVMQERGRAKVLKFDSLPQSLRVGERVALEGRFVTHIASFPDYPDKPAGSEVLDAFEAPENAQDHYVSRLRAWLRPPVDGNYSFWIAADDEAELWLSSDSNPANAKKIASVTKFTKPRDWDRDEQQASRSVELKAGKMYYIEAIHREGLGTDNLAVAWKGPDFEQSVIAAEFLQPWRAEGGKSEGVLREYWTNRFFTSLSALSPGTAGPPVIEVSEARISRGAGAILVRPSVSTWIARGRTNATSPGARWTAS